MLNYIINKKLKMIVKNLKNELPHHKVHARLQEQLLVVQTELMVAHLHHPVAQEMKMMQRVIMVQKRKK